MTESDTESQGNQWSHDDMLFAAIQLAQEFPAEAKEKLAAAINSAASACPPFEGRVRLFQRAREFLRKRP